MSDASDISSLREMGLRAPSGSQPGNQRRLHHAPEPVAWALAPPGGKGRGEHQVVMLALAPHAIGVVHCPHMTGDARPAGDPHEGDDGIACESNREAPRS